MEHHVIPQNIICLLVQWETSYILGVVWVVVEGTCRRTVHIL